MTIKPILKNVCPWALALVAAVFVGCSGDDAPAPFQPSLPAQGGSNVTAITYQGNASDCYNWAFTYTGLRLTKATATLVPASGAEGYSYTSTLTYAYNSLGIQNTSETVSDIQLNTKNCIEKMKVNLNTYTFSYDSDGRLIAWRKQIVENSFGQNAEYTVSASLTYNTAGDLIRIIYTGADDKPITLTLTPTTNDNRNGLLPATISKEMGCLGFEHLYYAGLLGKASTHLTQSISYSYDDETKNYSTSFEYATQGGNATLCNYHTPNGGVASVNYAY